MAENKHLVPGLVTVSKFAELMNVDYRMVYYRINSTKEIETTKIGKRRFIDWYCYKNFKFIKQKSQNLVTVYKFAQLKGVSNVIIYYRINKTKEIETIKIGKRLFIDWDRFKDFKFSKADKQKILGKHQSQLASVYMQK